jgi:CrcB protein
MPVPIWFAIAVAGAFGAVSRHLLVHAVQAAAPGFPLGTLVVNLVGCFLYGLCWAVGHDRWSPALAAALLTGFFGAFTTFSSFAFDCVHLLQQGRLFAALVDVLAQNTLGLLGLWAGIACGGGWPKT